MASIQKRPGRGGRLRYRVQIRLRGGVRSATFPTLQEARQSLPGRNGEISNAKELPFTAQ
jgi:hypothetical protein